MSEAYSRTVQGYLAHEEAPAPKSGQTEVRAWRLLSSSSKEDKCRLQGLLEGEVHHTVEACSRPTPTGVPSSQENASH